MMPRYLLHVRGVYIEYGKIVSGLQYLCQKVGQSPIAIIKHKITAHYALRVITKEKVMVFYDVLKLITEHSFINVRNLKKRCLKKMKEFNAITKCFMAF